MPAKRIPLPSVPIVGNLQTGLMEENWYDFFQNIGQAQRLVDAVNDTQAAAAGVPLYGLYRTSSIVKVRMT
jgi:hypothetical protein